MTNDNISPNQYMSMLVGRGIQGDIEGVVELTDEISTNPEIAGYVLAALTGALSGTLMKLSDITGVTTDEWLTFVTQVAIMIDTAMGFEKEQS